MATIRNILEEIGLPQIREQLGYLLGKTIPEETKEIQYAKNKIYIRIENTFSGKVFHHTMEFNRTDTIGEMKKQVKEFLEEHQGVPLYEFHFHNEDRQTITNSDTDTLDILYHNIEIPVLAVDFNTGNLLIKLLEKYPNKHWSWDCISQNPNITMDFIEKFSNKPWEWNYISKNPNITMEIIEKYPDKPWNWRGVSMNQNITMDIIEKYPNEPWDWYCISMNSNITMEIIEKYPNKPWNWEWISENPNITIEFIEKYPNKPWDWDGISMNPNITMDIIEKHPEKPWNWEWISKNQTMEIIEKYPNKPWDWKWISRNPNITMEFIEKYINKINFQELSRNIFTCENKHLQNKESYWLLEKIQAFNKTENLVILSKYM